MPLRQLFADVYSWSERHGKPGRHYPWNSFAIRIARAHVLVLVDPLPLAEDEIRTLDELGPPTHVLLTCNWHLRETAAHRQRWGCWVLLHHLGLAQAEVPIDDTFGDGDRLWDTVTTIHLPDVYWPEETAFLVDQGPRVLLVGDALCGGRADQGVPEGEVGISSTAAEHIADLGKAHVSLRRLLRYSPDAMGFGHGSPVVRGPQAALRQFLQRQDVWACPG